MDAGAGGAGLVALCRRSRGGGLPGDPGPGHGLAADDQRADRRAGTGADGDRGRSRLGRAGGEDARDHGLTWYLSLDPLLSRRPPRGRYAPSPTGMIHLGNARTALAAWPSVRSRKGAFIWRVEDLDGQGLPTFSLP